MATPHVKGACLGQVPLRTGPKAEIDCKCDKDQGDNLLGLGLLNCALTHPKLPSLAQRHTTRAKELNFIEQSCSFGKREAERRVAG